MTVTAKDYGLSVLPNGSCGRARHPAVWHLPLAEDLVQDGLSRVARRWLLVRSCGTSSGTELGGRDTRISTSRVGAGQMLDAVDEVRPQAIRFGRGADVGEVAEQFPEHHGDLSPGEMGT